MRASEARIARVKARYAGRPTGWTAETAATGTAAHQLLAQEIADRAVTLVRNAAGAIPVASGRVAVVSAGSGAGDRPPTGLGQELAGVLPGVTVAASPDEVARGSWDTVVVASLSLRKDDGVDTVRALHQQFGERLVVVGTGSPYELLRFPEVTTYLATYGPDPASLRAAAKVLAGMLEPSGRLPVALPGLYERGWRFTARA